MEDNILKTKNNDGVAKPLLTSFDSVFDIYPELEFVYWDTKTIPSIEELAEKRRNELQVIEDWGDIHKPLTSRASSCLPSSPPPPQSSSSSSKKPKTKQLINLSILTLDLTPHSQNTIFKDLAKGLPKALFNTSFLTFGESSSPLTGEHIGTTNDGNDDEFLFRYYESLIIIDLNEVDGGINPSSLLSLLKNCNTIDELSEEYFNILKPFLDNFRYADMIIIANSNDDPLVRTLSYNKYFFDECICVGMPITTRLRY